MIYNSTIRELPHQKLLRGEGRRIAITILKKFEAKLICSNGKTFSEYNFFFFFLRFIYFGSYSLILVLNYLFLYLYIYFLSVCILFFV